MNYNCPHRKTCNSIRCAHHISASRTEPVHSPCEWYEKYLLREELKQHRKDKLNKIETRLKY